MRETSAHIPEWLGDWVGGGGSLLLMTDYDGTLTPIVNDPEDACLTDEVRERLRALARTPGVRVAVISGRDLEDLRERVAVPELIYAGCHGLEISGPNLSFSHPDAEAQQDAVHAVSMALCMGAPFIEGMRVEPKRLGVAVHYRHVASAGRQELETVLARSLHRKGGQFKLIHGHKVIEVLPQVSWNKGLCALWIRDRMMIELPAPMIVFYMGDDWTDEYAFEILVGKAVTVRVGEAHEPSKADYRIRGVDEVERLLTNIASAVVERRAS